jgi:puromycin-sensitive aminopeptidase
MLRLPATPRPKSYDLHLKIDPRRDRFRGEVALELVSEKRVRRILLHSVDLDIDRVALEDCKGSVGIREWAARAKDEMIELRLERALEPGDATLRVTYKGPIRSDLRGLYLARSGRRRYAVTQLEATDARRVFPCFDEPAMKARFRVQVTTPNANTIISNAPQIRSTRHGAQKTVDFAETPPLSTYLVALIVGELEGSQARKCGQTPIRVWAVPGNRKLMGFALEAAHESLSRLERYFGLPYPYAKLDLIAVPDFEFGAMENAGAVTFRESLLLVDPKTVTLQEKKRVAEVIAHELAHMWYGDLVTMAWWDDLWLNEAFATWMAFTVVADWKPEWQMWLDFERHRAAAFSLDALRNTHPIYTTVRSPSEATENFDAITYEKGASVVRMVERWLGAPVFRKGVRRYIRRHREGNARAQDLWEALEEASGGPVAPVVREWIERPGFPVVELRRTDEAGKSILELRQDRFYTRPGPPSEDESPWPVPLVLRVRPTRGRTRVVRQLLDRRETRIPLGGSDDIRWVYANADEGGFYRALHHGELLAALLRDRDRLAPVERVGLAGHQWAALRSGRADLSDLLSVVETYRDEEEPEALESLLGGLAFLADPVAWSAGASLENHWRAWVAENFGEAFHALGWRSKRGESDSARLRRAALLRIVGGIAEDPGVVEEAEAAFVRYRRDRTSLDPNLAGPVVEIAAWSGDKAQFEAYVREVKRARTPQDRMRFQMALAAFRDPVLIQRALELTLTDLIPTQNVALLLGRLLSGTHQREAAWEFVQKRWSELSTRLPPGLASRLVLALPALHTRRHKREVSQFFRAHPLPTAQRALKQTLERFDLDNELRRRTVPQLRTWLRDRPRRTAR